MGGSPARDAANGGRTRAIRGALAFALTMLPVAVLGELPDAPKRAAGFRGAAGAVVQYEESVGNRILYHEEKGGLIVPVAPPVEGSRREVLPPLAPAKGAPVVPAAKAAAAAAGGGTAKR
jgi:hypothetical protein